MFRDVDDPRSDQDQIEALWVHQAVPFEKREQFRTPLVRVDPADVDGERPFDAELFPETPRLHALGNFRSDAADHTRQLLAAHALNERALLERVEHDGAR